MASKLDISLACRGALKTRHSIFSRGIFLMMCILSQGAVLELRKLMPKDKSDL